jgi:hypothetical protein
MIRYSICVILCFGVIFTNAQTKEKPKSNKKPKEYIYPSNVIKLNLTGLLFKSVGVQYERKIGQHISAALGVIYRPTSGFLYYDVLSQNTANTGFSTETAQMYGTAKMGRLSITPEVRYYFKKNTPKGLYLSPFFRYQREVTPFKFNYYESNVNPTVQKTGNAVIKDNSVGVGILFGLQILSRKKLAIDFWFLGPWFGQTKSTLVSKINTTNINAFDKAIIASNMEPVYYNYAVNWNASGINSINKRYSIGARFIGINIGYNF